MSKFQIITLAIFVICLIAGVAAFALYKGKGSSSSALPPITIWGTFPSSTFDQYVGQINQGAAEPLSINYVQEDPSSFSQDFISALARGAGPDAILVPVDSLLPYEDKLTPIPYTAFPQRTFLNDYVDEADLYLTPNGLLGVPFTIDPLIMYWNKDTFDAAGIAAPPQYWDQFAAMVPKLTVTDQNGNVRRSAIAMGEFSNIDNGRELFGSLLMQLGDPVTALNAGGSTASALELDGGKDAIAALQFFDQFSDPSNSSYSWNRSLSDDQTSFLSGMLATYFGFASELQTIRAKNPNLNFDAAPLPQVRSGGQAATYGRMYGFSLVRASANANAAFQEISVLTTPQYLSTLSQAMYLPPVRRDLIAEGSSDPYISIFDQQALIANAWLDSSAAQSEQLFSDMSNYVTSGQKVVSQAVNDASNQYDVLLQQAEQQ